MKSPLIHICFCCLLGKLFNILENRKTVKTKLKKINTQYPKENMVCLVGGKEDLFIYFLIEKL